MSAKFGSSSAGVATSSIPARASVMAPSWRTGRARDSPGADAEGGAVGGPRGRCVGTRGCRFRCGAQAARTALIRSSRPWLGSLASRVGVRTVGVAGPVLDARRRPARQPASWALERPAITASRMCSLAVDLAIASAIAVVQRLGRGSGRRCAEDAGQLVGGRLPGGHDRLLEVHRLVHQLALDPAGQARVPAQLERAEQRRARRRRSRRRPATSIGRSPSRRASAVAITVRRISPRWWKDFQVMVRLLSHTYIPLVRTQSMRHDRGMPNADARDVRITRTGGRAPRLPG